MIGKSTKGSFFLSAILCAAGSAVLSGCGGAPADTSMPAGAITSTGDYQKRSELPLKADAGVPVPPKEGVDVANLKSLVASRTFLSRQDPFSLLGIEKQFEADRSAERLIQSYGYLTEWTPPVEPPPEIIEPQPYRRLAGVMVGDSVLAIIDMGDGRMQIVRPGEQISGTEWTVVSIDPEKAVLRRGGNRKPKEVVVPLAGSSTGIIVLPGGGGGGNRPPGGGGTGIPGGPGRGGVPPASD